MFIEQLKQSLSTTLPGEKAHLKMAPLSRPLSSLAKSNASSYRESAVAVVLFEKAGEWHIILIQRPVYEGNHSGQVSFPGGKREVQDEDLLQTAMRECQEEIGLNLLLENYIGSLTPVFIPVSSFHVDTHVFYLEDEPAFTTDEREVEAVFTIRVWDLMKEENIKQTDIPIGDQLKLKNVPYFDLEDKMIWGATALILSELREILQQINSEL